MVKEISPFQSNTRLGQGNRVPPDPSKAVEITPLRFSRLMDSRETTDFRAISVPQDVDAGPKVKEAVASSVPASVAQLPVVALKNGTETATCKEMKMNTDLTGMKAPTLTHPSSKEIHIQQQAMLNHPSQLEPLEENVSATKDENPLDFAF